MLLEGMGGKEGNKVFCHLFCVRVCVWGGGGGGGSEKFSGETRLTFGDSNGNVPDTILHSPPIINDLFLTNSNKCL